MSRKVEAQPEWFDLKKYEGVEKFSIRDWLFQLCYRFECLLLLKNKGTEQEGNNLKLPLLLEALKKNPITDPTDSTIRNLLKTSTVSIFTTIDENKVKSISGIHALTISELYQIEACLPENLRTHLRNYFLSTKFDEHGHFDFSNSEDLSFLHEAALEHAELFCLFNKTCITVDLTLNDSVLKEQFSKFLTTARKEAKSQKFKELLRENFGPNNRKTKSLKRRKLTELHVLKILPYIDLKIYEVERGKIIDPDSFISFLHPDSDAQHDTKTLSETLKPLANNLLSIFTLEKIAAQIYENSDALEIDQEKNPLPLL